MDEVDEVDEEEQFATLELPLDDFVAGQARLVAGTTPTRHCELARCGGSARCICVLFLSQTNHI